MVIKIHTITIGGVKYKVIGVPRDADTWNTVEFYENDVYVMGANNLPMTPQTDLSLISEVTGLYTQRLEREAKAALAHSNP